MRKCKNCKELYEPTRTMQRACGPQCALALVLAAKEKKEKADAKAERKETKAKRAAIKTRRDWINGAKTAVHKFIHLRDAGRPCISCGAPLRIGGVGGGFDAGHFRSVGSAPHLRFDPRNIHGQCKRCNSYGGGRYTDYRVGLIKRYGLKFVEEIEADQTPRKHTIEELIGLIQEFREKARDLDIFGGQK